jgi:hypothetical protein
MDLKLLHTKRKPPLVSPVAKCTKARRQTRAGLRNSFFLSLISKHKRSKVCFFLDLAQRLALTTMTIFKGAIKPEQPGKQLSSN